VLQQALQQVLQQALQQAFTAAQIHRLMAAAAEEEMRSSSGGGGDEFHILMGTRHLLPLQLLLSGKASGVGVRLVVLISGKMGGSATPVGVRLVVLISGKMGGSATPVGVRLVVLISGKMGGSAAPAPATVFNSNEQHVPVTQSHSIFNSNKRYVYLQLLLHLLCLPGQVFDLLLLPFRDSGSVNPPAPPPRVSGLGLGLRYISFIGIK